MIFTHSHKFILSELKQQTHVTFRSSYKVELRNLVDFGLARDTKDGDITITKKGMQYLYGSELEKAVILARILGRKSGNQGRH